MSDDSRRQYEQDAVKLLELRLKFDFWRISKVIELGAS